MSVECFCFTFIVFIPFPTSPQLVHTFFFGNMVYIYSFIVLSLFHSLPLNNFSLFFSFLPLTSSKLMPSFSSLLLPAAVPTVPASSSFSVPSCFFSSPPRYLSLRTKHVLPFSFLLPMPCFTVLACRLLKQFLSYKSPTNSLSPL